ncbi:hypothetical protein ASG72_18180 [Bosea sp. Leaf344]|nr:hypothetical protein ASG72_18180 [Bosea sp. Leaf344]
MQGVATTVSEQVETGFLEQEAASVGMGGGRLKWLRLGRPYLGEKWLAAVQVIRRSSFEARSRVKELKFEREPLLSKSIAMLSIATMPFEPPHGDGSVMRFEAADSDVMQSATMSEP